jgi:phosphinothricin acetyltransferase
MADPSIAVRPARRDDLQDILAIYNAAVPLRSATADLVPQQMAAREAWWNDRDHARRPVMVAEVAGRTVAWGAFTDFKPRAGYAPTAEVSVYVDPARLGLGIGRAMLDALLARAPECGIDRIVALCFAHNEASVRLFMSRGFIEWGRLPDACNMDGVRRSVVMLGKSVPG